MRRFKDEAGQLASSHYYNRNSKEFEVKAQENEAALIAAHRQGWNEAFKQYGGHTSECAWGQSVIACADEEAKCDCGFDDDIRRLRIEEVE